MYGFKRLIISVRLLEGIYLSCRRIIAVSLCLCLSAIFCSAQVVTRRGDFPGTHDSCFVVGSRPVIFPINLSSISKSDSLWLADTLHRQLQNAGEKAIIYGRAAASPEGPLEFNTSLAKRRCDAAISVLARMGFDVSRIRFDIIPEEWEILLTMMKMQDDSDSMTVRRYMNTVPDLNEREALMRKECPTVWNRLRRMYFPELRAVRIMATLPEAVGIDPLTPVLDDKTNENTSETAEDSVFSKLVKQYRREVLSVKTNLLFYGAYVPKYGWAPIPNVALEFYPRSGHFTVGASLDCPWWKGNTTNHKYFEIRNWQLEGRYYLRNSKKSYDEQHNPNGQAAFKGLYFSVYAHAFLYQIGFNEKDGWIGEGAGGGIGIGYVFPLSRRNQHWRMEIGAQAGYLWTQYDPYVYGCPVENVKDGLYYYDWAADGNQFSKRQHHKNLILPTRISLTITYDLLYRRGYGKKGISFRRFWKGGAR